MHRGPRRTHGLVLILGWALGACGPEPDPGPELEVGFESQALLAEADLIAIYFYEASRTCASIRASQPRPASILGPFQAALDEMGRQAGVSFQLSEVPVGTYVVFVDALTNVGANVGSGCTPDQQVFSQQLSAIRVVVSDNP